MPANYPRTASRKFRRNQGRITESNEQKLKRIATCIGVSGSYACKTEESAESLASALNSHVIIGLGITAFKPGYYVAIGKNVYYQIFTEEEEVNDFVIERQDIYTEGYNLKQDTPQIEMDSNSVTFSSIVDLKEARDAEIASIKYDPTVPTENIIQTSYGEKDINSIDSLRFTSVRSEEGVHYTDRNIYYKYNN